MKRFFLLLLLPISSFAITENEFNILCTNISWSLENASLNVDALYRLITLKKDTAYQHVLYFQGLYDQSGNDYSKGMYEGAQAIYNDFDTNYNAYREQAQQSLQSAQVSLQLMRWTDYQVYLESLTNSNIQSLFELQSIHVATTNALDELSWINYYLDQINQFLFNRDDPMSPPLYLQDVLSALTNYMSSANYFFGVFDAIETEFRKYFQLVNSRIEHPDANLSYDLNQMWTFTRLGISQILSNSVGFRIHDQTRAVTSDSTIRLSNEGRIALDNLAVNQRNYICSVEALRYLGNVSNALERIYQYNITNQVGYSVADAQLDFITNYLWTVQRQYYTEFRSTSNYTSLYNPYTSTFFNPFTNYLNQAIQDSEFSDQRVELYNRFHDYRQVQTNFFDRLESYLLNMQGLIPSSASSIDSGSLQSATAYDHNLDESSNSVVQVLTALSSVSNGFSAVKSSVESIFRTINNFVSDESQNQAPSVFQFFPSFEVMGYEFPPLEVSYESIQPVLDAIRLVFVTFWTCLFGLIGFKLVYEVIRLFFLSLTRTILLVSTFLGST